MKRGIKNGFTLLEVVVSMFIFTVVLGQLIVIYNQNFRNTSNQRHRLQADYLAQQGFEAVRAIYLDVNKDWTEFKKATDSTDGFASVDGCTEYNLPTPNKWSFTPGALFCDAGPSGLSFERQVTIYEPTEVIKGISVDDYRIIEVEVKWPNNQIITKQYLIFNEEST